MRRLEHTASPPSLKTNLLLSPFLLPFPPSCCFQTYARIAATINCKRHVTTCQLSSFMNFLPQGNVIYIFILKINNTLLFIRSETHLTRRYTKLCLCTKRGGKDKNNSVIYVMDRSLSCFPLKTPQYLRSLIFTHNYDKGQKLNIWSTSKL